MKKKHQQQHSPHGHQIIQRPGAQAQAQEAPPPQPSAVDQAPQLSGEVPKGPPVRGFRFTIPDSVRKENDPYWVVLRELGADDYVTANKLAGGDDARVSQEVVKLSLHQYEDSSPKGRGRVINHGEAEGDLLWRRWSARCRTLLQRGWTKIHNTTDEEDKDFLDSMEPV